MLNKPDIIRILLIEDNPADSDLIKELLEEVHDFNYELVVEITLYDGLERAGKEKFDIILLDLTLPDAFGLETLRIAHFRIKHLPIIILSGHEDEEIILKAMKEGVQDYIIKGSYNGILRVFSAFSYFFQALIFAIVATITGYDPALGTNNSEFAKFGLKLQMSIIPMIIILIGTILFIFMYKITKEDAIKNKEKLIEMDL